MPDCGMFKGGRGLVKCGHKATWHIVSYVRANVFAVPTRHDTLTCDQHFARAMRESPTDGVCFVWPAGAELPAEIHASFR